MRSIVYISCIILTAMCFHSCKRMDLHVPESSVYVSFHLEDILSEDEFDMSVLESHPEMSERIYGQSVQFFKICLYDVETHEFVDEDIIPVEGGFIALPSGNFDVLIHSLNLNISIFDHSLGLSNIYACTGISEEFADVIFEPEHIYVSYMPNVHIPKSSSSDLISVNVNTESITGIYSLEFSHVDGLDDVKEVSVSVSAQIAGRYLSDCSPYEKNGTLSFTPIIDEEKSSIYGLYNSFGFDEDASEIYVTLSVTDISNKTHEWVIDITDQIGNSENDERRIVIDEIIFIPDSTLGE